jgi:hypothetical protein
VIQYGEHTKVVVSGDRSSCRLCGNEWDTNDPYLPPCVTTFEGRMVMNKERWLIYVVVWAVVLFGILALYFARH